MSLPAGYKAWCEHRGISPYHPLDEWTPADHAAFKVWKLYLFKLSWELMDGMGFTSYMSAEMIRDKMRESLEMLERPVPSRPWMTCPCHPAPTRMVEAAPVTHGLDYIRSFGRRVP